MLTLMNPSQSFISNQDILIVDDTINNIKLLADMLSQAGFSVRKAISGSMALVAVDASKPDLILLDINMPEIDGYQVCQQLKQNPMTQEVPVIFLSASNMTEDKVKAFSIGGCDYITKPFHTEEVIARIQNQLLLSQLKAELQTKNQELEQALLQLQQTQAELVQQQKMISLSQLIAGIAHEFNNPIGFIAGNLKPAKQYFFDLVQILELYRQKYPEPGAEIDAAIADLELDFITTDFAQAVQSMEVGTTRIRNIVQALQIFSLQGESTVKTIQLNSTINNILVLLRSRLHDQGNRPSINVSCEYDAQLPDLTCDAGLISQAILYVLDNAIDAIDAQWVIIQSAPVANQAACRLPQITITTHVPKPDWIAVTIRDNGIGIADGLKSRVYDPFFTTKAVGKGNGLGLSISYQIIVNQHGGHLSFTSSPGEGSEFVLQLPCAMTKLHKV